MSSLGRAVAGSAVATIGMVMLYVAVERHIPLLWVTGIPTLFLGSFMIGLGMIDGRNR